MRRPLILGTIATALILGALVTATFVLAGRSGDRIAKGIHVGTVYVGGLTPAQARARLQHALVRPLHQPILVRHGDRTFGLGASTAGVRTDIDAMVADAIARSKRGNVIDRALREVTGARVDAFLPADVTYSRRAVTHLVDRVEGAVNRPAKDAVLSYTPDGLGEVSDRAGLAVRADSLQARVERALTRPDAVRSFGARTRVIHPKVTKEMLARKNPTVLVVSRNQFQLKLYKNLKLAKSYDIAVGMQGLETPAGLYHIQNKAINPAWSVPQAAWAGSLAGTVVPGGTPQNPLKARWLGIFDGAGIHGIDPSEYGSIGHAASHGCVRMRIEDVIDLYPRVAVNAPIFIS